VSKFNIDGCAFGNPREAGFGGGVREWSDVWIVSFFGSCGVASNTLAELQVIF